MSVKLKLKIKEELNDENTLALALIIKLLALIGSIIKQKKSFGKSILWYNLTITHCLLVEFDLEIIVSVFKLS